MSKHKQALRDILRNPDNCQEIAEKALEIEDIELQIGTILHRKRDGQVCRVKDINYAQDNRAYLIEYSIFNLEEVNRFYYLA